MTPEEITTAFTAAAIAYGQVEGKPSDDDLTGMRRILLPILIKIDYDKVKGIHSLQGLIEPTEDYAPKHNSTAFERPKRPPIFPTIKDDVKGVAME